MWIVEVMLLNSCLIYLDHGLYDTKNIPRFYLACNRLYIFISLQSSSRWTLTYFYTDTFRLCRYVDSDIFKYLPVSSALLEAQRYLFTNVTLSYCSLDFIVHGLLKQNTQEYFSIIFFRKGKPERTRESRVLEQSWKSWWFRSVAECSNANENVSVWCLGETTRPCNS